MEGILLAAVPMSLSHLCKGRWAAHLGGSQNSTEKQPALSITLKHGEISLEFIYSKNKCVLFHLKHCWTSGGVVENLAEDIQIQFPVFVIFCGYMQYVLYSAYIVPFAFYITEWFYNIILCLLFVGISCLNMDLGLQLSSAQPVRTIP